VMKLSGGDVIRMCNCDEGCSGTGVLIAGKSQLGVVEPKLGVREEERGTAAESSFINRRLYLYHDRLRCLL
jgi:hypothetical protein